MKDPKEETTYGLSPDRLAKLLAIGLEGKKEQDDLEKEQTAAKVLQEMLSSELPSDEAPGGGRTVNELLFDPKSSLSVIKTLKEYGKELARRADPEAEKAAATMIYYAAVAGGLVFHRQKITRQSYAKLKEAYADLEQKPWVPSELNDLFQQARAVCGQQKGKAE